MRSALLLFALGAMICGWQKCTPVVASENQSADQTFLREADEIDMAEVKLGKLAQERAASDAVKKFGERMVYDHSRMNKELREIASGLQTVLPARLDSKHQKLLEQLSKLKGAAFDRAYTKDMVSGHEKAIAKFETEARSGREPEVKAWATKRLATLKVHLELARKTVREINELGAH